MVSLSPFPNHHHHYYHHKDNRPATLKSTNTDSGQIFIRLLFLLGGEEPSRESVTYIAHRSLSASLVKTKILAWQIVIGFIYFESNIIMLNALFHMKNLQNTQEIITQLKKDPLLVCVSSKRIFLVTIVSRKTRSTLTEKSLFQEIQDHPVQVSLLLILTGGERWDYWNLNFSILSKVPVVNL